MVRATRADDPGRVPSLEALCTTVTPSRTALRVRQTELMSSVDPRSISEAQAEVDEAAEVRRVRQARDAALTPEERIERLHAICASAAAFERATRLGPS